MLYALVVIPNGCLQERPGISNGEGRSHHQRLLIQPNQPTNRPANQLTNLHPTGPINSMSSDKRAVTYQDSVNKDLDMTYIPMVKYGWLLSRHQLTFPTGF